MTIHYQISAHGASAHIFTVQLTIEAPNPAGQQLQLPVWIPGSYLIREFARNIVQIKAFANQQALPVEKINKSTWQLGPCEGPVMIQYEVYAFDLSVRGAYLDQERAFFNGTSVFLAVVGQEHLPCEVSMARTNLAQQKPWQLATGLCAVEIDSDGFGQYRASSYDELIDCPVEISQFSKVEFEACGIPHLMVISGRHNADLERLARDLKPICEYQIRLFGEPAPFDRYVFMTMAVGDGYGGLEHRNSTALICNRNDLPTSQLDKISSGYRQFLGLCSHEYFHSWNVKRIKPAAYAPYDLQQENYTSLLWAFEGITSYYDDLTLLRAGLISFDDYLELLAQTASSVYRGYGHQRQSLKDSSIDTWVKYYRQDENSPNELVSYYTKGALVALCLDLHIRKHTQNQKSLDDVMRALWQRFGKDFAQHNTGVNEDEWEQIASEVSGLPLREFFDLAIRSTTELPLAELLLELGVETQLRPQNGANDKGGWLDSMPKASTDWGMRYSTDGLGVKISNVFRGKAASVAGLSAGDQIIAINGIKVGNQFEQWLTPPPGQVPYRVHAFRRDELMEFQVLPQTAENNTFGFRKATDLCQEKMEFITRFMS